MFYVLVMLIHQSSIDIIGEPHEVLERYRQLG